MLQVAEARLAVLQVIDQKAITDRLGAISGASQQISSFAANVQGAPVPGITTTSRGATGSTTEVDQTTPTATTNTVTTQSGLAAQDVVTTRPQFSPPGATAPAPTTTLPSSGFSVSSSDILNEQMQLTAEINGLRLLLSGSLSDYFTRDGRATKLKTTIGFPIAIILDKRYKDAVAIVEVEVEKTATATENPAVTQILPREKTYNVAAITDKSTSIGGGVATQIVGFSGSWFRGHRTYYIVQDQDTVALSFKPANPNRVGFMWEFRPVLGRRYIKAGLKQTFVQVAFAVPANAQEGEIGKVIVRTYWRKYDRDKGVHKDIIPGSLSRQEVTFNIPRFELARRPPSFTERNLEDLGGGQMLVKLRDKFLPGTYVRIGGTLLTTAQQRIMHDYAGIRFSAPISELATRGVYLVAHDGTEVPLTFNMPSVCGVVRNKSAAGVFIGTTTREFVGTGMPTITTLDENNSRLSVDFTIKKTVKSAAGSMETTENPPEELPALAIVIGSRVFGFADAPIQRTGNTLTAVVPTSVLVSNPKLTIQLLFPEKQCRADVSLASFSPPSQAERLVILERGSPTKYLLYGTRLSTLTVLSPAGVVVNPIGAPNDPDRLALIQLSEAQLKSNKQLLVQRAGERPFLLTIPESDVKKPDPPKASERVTVNEETTLIEGEGLKDLATVTFNKKPVPFEVNEDGKSVLLTGLRALGITSSAMTRTITLTFKSGAKTSVKLEVVNFKGETVTK